MSEAWIIDAARTPRGVGKQGKGALWEVHPQKLLSTVLRALAERSDLKTDEIDDVIMSCSSQFQKQGSCVGRMAALDAGFSTRASGVTLDRFCGGGITAVNLAAANIMSGMEDLIVAGGVEMMSYTRSGAPFPFMLVTRICADCILSLMWAYRGHYCHRRKFQPSRAGCVSLESQRRAGLALQEGAFDKSLVAVPTRWHFGAGSEDTRVHRPRRNLWRVCSRPLKA